VRLRCAAARGGFLRSRDSMGIVLGVMLAAARKGDRGQLSFCWSQVCVLRGQLELASDVFSERTTYLLCAWRLQRVM
jgi:hypothetical protein